MIQPLLVEHIKDPIADQMVDILVLPVMEEIVVVSLMPHERVERRTADADIMDVPVPQILEGTVEVVRVGPT